MEVILFAALRGVIAYFLVLTVVRLIGRKAISQMTFFDLVVSITMGSLASNLGIGEDRSPVVAGTVLVTFGILSILTSWAVLKSVKLRKLIVSEPVIVISKGELVRKNMRKMRLTVDMINSLLRENNAFNISDVEYAVMENDGKISVLMKSAKQPLTPSDMNIQAAYKGLVTDLIIDGKLLYKNLQKAGKTQSWITEELNKKHLRVEDVFFAALDSSGSLYLSLGEGTEENKIT